MGPSGGMGAYIAVVGQLHVLGEVETFDGGDVPDIKEPDVGKHLAFEDETSNNATENINVNLQVGGRINQCKLQVISSGVHSL